MNTVSVNFCVADNLQSVIQAALNAGFNLKVDVIPRTDGVSFIVIAYKP